MKRLILSILVLALILSSEIAVATTTSAKVNQIQAITIAKPLKSNKQIKLKKSLKLNVPYWKFKSSKPTVAVVSKKGTITAVEDGKATIKGTAKNGRIIKVKVKVKTPINYTKKQLRLMASIIYSEAGDQSYAGKLAVGIVIMNRVKSKAYPNTLKKVIYAPYQFGPVRNGSLKRSYRLYDKGQLDKGCIKAAKAALKGAKYVTYKKKTINFKQYTDFSGYVPGAKLKIDGHMFK